MNGRKIIDEALPLDFVAVLSNHGCRVEAFPQAWRGLNDGQMLDAFDGSGGGILVTCDRNIRFQQRFDRRRIGLVVLPGQRLAQLVPLARDIAGIIERAATQQIIVVDRLGRASLQSG